MEVRRSFRKGSRCSRRRTGRPRARRGLTTADSPGHPPIGARTPGVCVEALAGVAELQTRRSPDRQGSVEILVCDEGLTRVERDSITVPGILVDGLSFTL